MKRKKRLTRNQKKEKFRTPENYRRAKAEKERHNKAVTLNEELIVQGNSDKLK